MGETESLFSLLRRTADPAAAAAIEEVVTKGTDRDLNRINPLAFAEKHHLNTEATIAAFLHAARLGLFEMQWNMLCPGCGGVLGENASLKTVHEDVYNCRLCAAGYEPTLDETIDVNFTVSPRVRRIAAHDPDSLTPVEYYRQVFWSTGVRFPEEDFDADFEQATLDMLELPPGEKAFLTVPLPEGKIVVFDPVTHAAHFLLVEGEPTKERQALSITYNEVSPPSGYANLRPGQLRVAFDNRTKRRVLPTVWVLNDRMHEILGRRQPFLTAKRLLSNQTFRDLYRADALDIDQRLKILSLTFLFTDLRGSTALYERVGDLAAYDLVRSHFHVLHDIVSEEAGAVVKTIGDAVMATFVTPDRAIAAALRMRDGMARLNDERGHEDLLLKIGIHEGPCLAVNLNDRQDYFGQTVNIASRVQNLAVDRSIYATEPVVEDATSAALLREHGLVPTFQQQALRGITERVKIYEIP
ncbi:MAG TPA: adenylate/guanylate cyclase domain-containing protein [Bauldia sp.]|nr:adenylate/guanylate cyclase domain-containing protein [Bauldia sp.]